MLTHTSTFSGYSVDDIDAAKEFYGETLGIDVKETKEGLELHPKGGQTIFLYPKQDHVPATYTVLNFMVEDIDAAAAALAASGIALERYEGMHQDGNGITRGREAGMGPDIAWFKDPAGNILSILHEAL